MTRWDCELVNRLRRRFWLAKSVSTDDEVLQRQRVHSLAP